MRLSQLLPSLVLLAACSGTPTETDPPPPPTPCGDTPPEVLDPSVVDNGPLETDDGVWPSLRVSFGATDADGALTSYTIHVAYDDDIDGLFDFDEAVSASNSFGPHDCNLSEASLFLDIAVNGDPPPDVFIELSVVVEDADGQRSEPSPAITITTPTE